MAVNSFIESEVLTSLEAAGRPRPCSPHKAELHLHLCTLPVCPREKHVLHMDAKPSPAFVLHHSHSLYSRVSPGRTRCLLESHLFARLYENLCACACACVFSFESNPKSHQKRTGCHVRGSPLFVLWRKQDAQAEESPSAGDGAPAETGEVTWSRTEARESSFQCHITDLQVPTSACEPTQ